MWTLHNTNATNIMYKLDYILIIWVKCTYCLLADILIYCMCDMLDCIFITLICVQYIDAIDTVYV